MLDHHERLDGSGYPRGLRHGELDLETRILAVCEAFDALMSERVYREAWSRDDAMSLLLREAGTGFDPSCVEALQRVLAREDGVVHPRQVPVGEAQRPLVAH